jgi:hypothetical protein
MYKKYHTTYFISSLLHRIRLLRLLSVSDVIPILGDTGGSHVELLCFGYHSLQIAHERIAVYSLIQHVIIFCLNSHRCPTSSKGDILSTAAVLRLPTTVKLLETKGCHFLEFTVFYFLPSTTDVPAVL